MNFYKIGNGNKVILSDDATDLEWAVAKEKARRNNYLAESDWTQVTDNGMSSSKKDEWKTYRQELRDLDTSTDPNNITWPTKPE